MEVRHIFRSVLSRDDDVAQRTRRVLSAVTDTLQAQEGVAISPTAYFAALMSAIHAHGAQLKGLAPEDPALAGVQSVIASLLELLHAVLPQLPPAVVATQCDPVLKVLTPCGAIDSTPVQLTAVLCASEVLQAQGRAWEGGAKVPGWGVEHVGADGGRKAKPAAYSRKLPAMRAMRLLLDGLISTHADVQRVAQDALLYILENSNAVMPSAFTASHCCRVLG